MAHKKKRATRIGKVDIPKTRTGGEDLSFAGRVTARESRRVGGTKSPTTRSIRLRQGETAAQQLIAGTIAASRAKRPATPEEKRNGNITPSTTPQAANGNGVTVSLFSRSERELEKLKQ